MRTQTGNTWPCPAGRRALYCDLSFLSSLHVGATVQNRLQRSTRVVPFIFQRHPRWHKQVDTHPALHPPPPACHPIQAHLASAPSRWWPQTTLGYHQAITPPVMRDPFHRSENPSQPGAEAQNSQSRTRDKSRSPLPLLGSILHNPPSPPETRRWLSPYSVAWPAGWTGVPRSMWGQGPTWPRTSLRDTWRCEARGLLPSSGLPAAASPACFPQGSPASQANGAHTARAAELEERGLRRPDRPARRTSCTCGPEEAAGTLRPQSVPTGPAFTSGSLWPWSGLAPAAARPRGTRGVGAGPPWVPFR